MGDFRLSLAVSARKAGVKHIAVANAYWSPYGTQTFLFPEYEYPLSRLVGRSAARSVFRLLRPIGFAAHTRPLNVVCREHGLPGIGHDIRVMYTFGDFTAYADVPELVPLRNLPANHRYVGAVLWSPAVRKPEWWDRLPDDRPIVYVTPGSSGESRLPVGGAGRTGRAAGHGDRGNGWQDASRTSAEECLDRRLPSGDRGRGPVGPRDLQWRQPDHLPGAGGGRARPRYRQQQHGPAPEHGRWFREGWRWPAARGEQAHRAACADGNRRPQRNRLQDGGIGPLASGHGTFWTAISGDSGRRGRSSRSAPERLLRSAAIVDGQKKDTLREPLAVPEACRRAADSPEFSRFVGWFGTLVQAVGDEGGCAQKAEAQQRQRCGLRNWLREACEHGVASARPEC